MRLSLYISLLFGVRRLVAALIYRRFDLSARELDLCRPTSAGKRLNASTSAECLPYFKGVKGAMAPAPSTVAQTSPESLVALALE
jgi:hypothetical protein